MKKLILPLFALIFCGTTSSVAQPATKEQMGKFAGTEGYGVIHMRTKIGSIKSLDGEGRMEISFTGTLLISELDGKVSFTGKIRKEFDRKGRAVYTGSGTAIVEGSWRGVQFFGTDLNSTWYGLGFIRVTGEFDEDLNTGDYWYENADEKRAFPNANIISDVVPDPRIKPTEKRNPTERKKK